MQYGLSAHLVLNYQHYNNGETHVHVDDHYGYQRNYRRGVVTNSCSSVTFNYFNNNVSSGYCGTTPTHPSSGVTAGDLARYVNNAALCISGCDSYCRVYGTYDPNCVTCCTCGCGAGGNDFYSSNPDCGATTTTATTPVYATRTPKTKITRVYTTKPPKTTATPPPYK